PVGKVSNFQAASEGGVMLHVKSKLPLDVRKLNEELPAYANNLRLMRQQDAFNMWFSREAEKGLRDTPLLQRKQPSNMPRPKKSYAVREWTASKAVDGARARRHSKGLA